MQFFIKCVFLGLNRYVRALQDVYETDPTISATGMSRADFWALCGDEAVQTGRRNAGGGKYKNLVVKIYKCNF